jgi:hypothetical protein
MPITNKQRKHGWYLHRVVSRDRAGTALVDLYASSVSAGRVTSWSPFPDRAWVFPRRWQADLVQLHSGGCSVYKLVRPLAIAS